MNRAPLPLNTKGPGIIGNGKQEKTPLGKGGLMVLL